MALKTFPQVNRYKIARGDVLFAPLLPDGSYELYSMLGNCPAFTLTVETENYQHTNSQGGVGVVDLTKVIRVTRSGNITVDNLDLANFGLFWSGRIITFVQASASVTNEPVNGIAPERICQLGTSVNIGGVRNITSVVPTVSAASRANSTPYLKGAIYQPATPNDHIYACTAGGTSANTPPTFTTDGTTFSDGTATFIDLGTVASLTADTDYVVDGPNGLLSIPGTGKLANLYNAAITAGLVDPDTGAPIFKISLSVNYTRPANTRKEVRAGTASSARGRLLFKAANVEGEDQDVLIPDVEISPTGDLAMIGEDEVSTMEFALGINLLNKNTPPVITMGESKAA